MSVDIVSSDDPSYLRWIERSILHEKNVARSSKKDPFAADFQQARRALEDATLELLRCRVSLEIDRVLRVERPRPHPRFGAYDFHELDGVLRVDDNSVLFCEIKHATSPLAALKAARKQLRKRLTESQGRWNESFGIAVCFQLSSIEYRETSLNHVPFDEFIQLFRQRQPPGTVISVSVQDATLRQALDDGGLKGQELLSELLKVKRLSDDPTLAIEESSDRFSNSLGNAFDQP